MSAPEKNKHYTYADYVTWDDGKRWELIDGVPYAMYDGDDAVVPVHVLDGCEISLPCVFSQQE